ncbi:MAG: hypothetical protein ABFD83_02880 [Armatimonadota bacterium]
MLRKNRLKMLLLAAALITAAANPAISASLGTKVIKGAAIGFAVTKTAGQLDKFINTVTFRHGMKSKLATKVVPILSVGEKGYIGGAQVSGPKAKVDSVKAVFQYEKNLSNNNYRAKVLLPSASLNPVKLDRVANVGISAIIDVALDGRLKYNTVGTGIQAGDVIKGAAVLVAVKNAGSAINKALNTITFNKGSVTKVVPMGSVGEKAYLGAAQICASSAVIGSVNALWQYEDLFSGGQFRVKILVPTTSSNPLKMKRVDGAGITAVVDMALSEQKDVDSKSDSHSTLKEILGSRTINSDKTKHDNGKHKGWYKGTQEGPKPFGGK